MKKVYVVVDKFLTDEDSWETHLTSLLAGYVESKGIKDVIVEEISELSTIKTYFEIKYIEPTDVFVFPDSWTNMIPYIKHWSEIYKIPVKMIGLWSRGCYINEDPVFRPIGDRNWRKVHERTNFRCMDKSFFINDYFKEQYRIYVSKLAFPERLHTCKFPLDYLSLELSIAKDKYYKQNSIIFPWQKYTSREEKMVYDFTRVFKGHANVIFAQEYVPLNRLGLLNQLSRAKIAFLPYQSPNIGKEIYECLLLETIPMVPDYEAFRELVPEPFRYPPEWTESIFSYSEHGPKLTEKIKEVLHNYEEYLPMIKELRESTTEQFFDSEQIINEIFG
jgi:hypothetical protein